MHIAISGPPLCAPFVRDYRSLIRSQRQIQPGKEDSATAKKQESSRPNLISLLYFVSKLGLGSARLNSCLGRHVLTPLKESARERWHLAGAFYVKTGQSIALIMPCIG
jgi:hypothetical protein